MQILVVALLTGVAALFLSALAVVALLIFIPFWRALLIGLTFGCVGVGGFGAAFIVLAAIGGSNASLSLDGSAVLALLAAAAFGVLAAGTVLVLTRHLQLDLDIRLAPLRSAYATITLSVVNLDVPPAARDGEAFARTPFGVPVFPRRPGARRVTTQEVNRQREELE